MKVWYKIYNILIMSYIIKIAYFLFYVEQVNSLIASISGLFGLNAALK